jgi:hypothetical protein
MMVCPRVTIFCVSRYAMLYHVVLLLVLPMSLRLAKLGSTASMGRFMPCWMPFSTA